MGRPYAVVLHIAEKNCTVEELNKLIGILKSDYNFTTLGGPSFSPDVKPGTKEIPESHVHNGTTLCKSVSGNDASTVFEGVMAQLEKIKISTPTRFNCQLTVAASDTVTDIVFIP